MNARPALEPLECRDCPSTFRLAVGGTRPADVSQGGAADCAFLAVLAAAAGRGEDLLSRLHRLRPQVWSVDLYPHSVAVRFTGAVTPLDPQLQNNEYWPLLFARAHLRLEPAVASAGETLESAGLCLLGRVPREDDSVRAVGLEAIAAALARGGVVVCCSDAHAYAVLRVTDREVILYDPWGAIRRIASTAFLMKPFEVAIL